MRVDEIKKAVDEAERFIKAANACIDARRATYRVGAHEFHGSAPKESGAVRRASLDLTRQLAVMRRP